MPTKHKRVPVIVTDEMQKIIEVFKEKYPTFKSDASVLRQLQKAGAMSFVKSLEANNG